MWDLTIISLKKAWLGSHYHATYASYSRGVRILVQRSLPFQLIDVKIYSEGRYIILHALIGFTVYVLVGLYLPRPVDITLLYSIMQTVSQYWETNVLLFRDFNLVLCSTLDRLHPAARWSPGLSQEASTFVLVDIWRHYNSSSK